MVAAQENGSASHAVVEQNRKVDAGKSQKKKGPMRWTVGLIVRLEQPYPQAI